MLDGLNASAHGCGPALLGASAPSETSKREPGCAMPILWCGSDDVWNLLSYRTSKFLSSIWISYFSILYSPYSSLEIPYLSLLIQCIIHLYLNHGHVLSPQSLALSSSVGSSAQATSLQISARDWLLLRISYRLLELFLFQACVFLAANWYLISCQ